MKRNYPRLEVRGEAELLAMDQTQPQREPITIQLFDLSWGGVGFLSPAPLAHGSQWRVLFMQHNRQIGQQIFEVRHCQHLGEGLNRIGAQVVIDTGLIAALGVDYRRLTGNPGTGAQRRSPKAG